MTIAGRNIFLRVGTVICSLLFLFYLAALYLAIGGGALSITLPGSGSTPSLTSLVSSGAVILTALTAVIVLHRFFRKSTSPEIFFFLSFLLTLGFEASRGGTLLLLHAGTPAYYGEMLTRVLFFGKFFGLLLLFSGGLLATGVQYQKHEMILGLCFIGSFAFAFAVPIDNSVLDAGLRYGAGIRWEISIITLFIEGFTIVNFVLARFLNTGDERTWMAVGAAIIILGRELLFSTTNPVVAAAAFALFCAGIILFGTKTHSLYMWV